MDILPEKELAEFKLIEFRIETVNNLKIVQKKDKTTQNVIK